MKRYQDFIDELFNGTHYGVFIDDTGSPGLKSTPANLHQERKTWVGVVVPPSQMKEVMIQFPKAIQELKSSTGADEFHFCDIYAGRKQFKDVGLQKRLAFFKFMAEIFSEYKFPIFVQTLDPSVLNNIRKNNSFPESFGPFNLRSQNDFALLILLFQIKQFLIQSRSGFHKARVFIDEGFKKSGTAILIPGWESIFADGLICFASSTSVFPIQLADFAAYSLNKTQLIIGKSNITSLELEFLNILEKVAWNFQNIEKGSASFTAFNEN